MILLTQLHLEDIIFIKFCYLYVIFWHAKVHKLVYFVCVLRYYICRIHNNNFLPVHSNLMCWSLIFDIYSLLIRRLPFYFFFILHICISLVLLFLHIPHTREYVVVLCKKSHVCIHCGYIGSNNWECMKKKDKMENISELIKRSGMTKEILRIFWWIIMKFVIKIVKKWKMFVLNSFQLHFLSPLISFWH